MSLSILGILQFESTSACVDTNIFIHGYKYIYIYLDPWSPILITRTDPDILLACAARFCDDWITISDFEAINCDAYGVGYMYVHLYADLEYIPMEKK